MMDAIDPNWKEPPAKECDLVLTGLSDGSLWGQVTLPSEPVWVTYLHVNEHIEPPGTLMQYLEDRVRHNLSAEQWVW